MEVYIDPWGCYGHDTLAQGSDGDCLACISFDQSENYGDHDCQQFNGNQEHFSIITSTSQYLGKQWPGTAVILYMYV